MRHLLLTISLFSFTLISSAQFVTVPSSGDNQKCKVSQYIGPLVNVTIKYSSPDVTSPSGEDRTGKIWGQLVHYGLIDQGFGLGNPSPWRAGANENTTIRFSHDVNVQGKPIKAGTYGLHVIVQESGPWTIIFSNNSTAWGSYFYKESEDALRVEATAKPSEFHEWLTYEFIDRQPESATVALKWENIQLPFKIDVPNQKAMIVANISRELQSSAGFNWQGWQQAADYCYQNDYNLEEGLIWAENAISIPFVGSKNFSTLRTKANILEKLGRGNEAEVVMKEAIDHPTATASNVHQYGRTLIGQNKKKEALAVFIKNAEKFKNAWPTNVGLARGYSATGQYDKALKYAKLALAQAPDKLNKDSMASAIAKLEKKEDIN